MRFFFFFKEKDAIRDEAVTGVQPCALPISPAAKFRPDRPELRGGGVGRDRVRAGRGRRLQAALQPGDGGPRAARTGRGRSEERRVGEEGRSRGWPYHLKKKKKKTKAEATRE